MKRTFPSHAAMTAWASTPEARGKVWHVMVLHGDRCTPSRCRCNPTYEVEVATEENLAEGERLEREWRKAKAS